MKLYKILILFVLFGSIVETLRSQEYDEQKTRAQIEKFQQNPKLYYDKIKALTAKLDEANQNTLKVSEEYLALLDQKDSIIAIYKNQLSKAKMNTGSKSTSTPVAAPVAPVVKTPAPEPVKEVIPESPYRVQLAAFKREDFVNFFTQSSKTFGVQKLDNRSVMEIQGFNTAEEAAEFSKKMRALGFPGAFVTHYNNGIRQEKVNYLSKAGLKSAASTPTKLTSAKKTEDGEQKSEIEYPNYIPLGYQELMGDKSKQMLKAAMAPPSVRNIPQPLTKFSSYQKEMEQSTTIPEGSLLPATTKAVTSPKAAASKATSTTNSSKKGAVEPPKANPANSTNPADPLDAAFDQLFKK